jgi:hypothetical protein
VWGWLDFPCCLTAGAAVVSDSVSGKTDIRWSDSEWAGLVEFAASSGQTPGRAAKAIVVERLSVLAAFELAEARDAGPAAPEERESSAAPALGNGAGCGDVGVAADGDAPGLGGDPGTGPAAASSRLAGGPGAGGALWHEGLGVAAQPPRPVGSAGSGVRPPAGGSAAVSSVVAEPAEGTRLVDACVAVLAAQGVPVGRARLLALREIRAGRVEVSGEVCSDPERLVDPASLGGSS